MTRRINMTLIEAAKKIATEAHAGMLRKDGKEYITHPIAVAGILGKDPAIIDGGLTEAIALALLHDVVEDTEMTTKDVADAMSKLLSYEVSDRFVYYLDALTRRPNERYAEYIKRVKTASGNAVRVKLADLKHNLNDHKPGARRDKYELAVLFLNN